MRVEDATSDRSSKAFDSAQGEDVRKAKSYWNACSSKIHNQKGFWFVKFLTHTET
jgi:hypothetical protein